MILTHRPHLKQPRRRRQSLTRPNSRLCISAAGSSQSECYQSGRKLEAIFPASKFGLSVRQLLQLFRAVQATIGIA